MQVYGNGISPWRLAPATRSVFGVRRFISAFNSHVSFIFNFALPQEQAGCPEGGERRTSGLRMAPGTSRTSPGPLAGGGGRSGCKALPLAGAASPLTCPPAAANPSSPALRAAPGGLRSLPFLVTCQRQVIPSHSFAARTRACCAPRIRRRSLTYVPRKWYYGLIYMPCKWLCRPTNALPMLVARTPPGGALACAPGSGTLPPA